MGGILAAIRSLYCRHDVLPYYLPHLLLSTCADYRKITQEAAFVFLKKKNLEPETDVERPSEGRQRRDGRTARDSAGYTHGDENIHLQRIDR